MTPSAPFSGKPRAPRRNVQRNPARRAAPPPLSTPKTQTVSPVVEPVDTASQSQESQVQPESPQRPRDSDEIPSIRSSIVPPIARPTEPAREVLEHASPANERATNRISSVSVEVYAPSSTSHEVQIIHPVQDTEGEIRARQDVIPAISLSNSSQATQKRKVTQQATPDTSEDSTQERDVSAADSRKRRKTTAAEDVEVHDQRNMTLSRKGPSILEIGPRARRSESRTSDALLQDATAHAATVSELANDIENRARSLTSRSERTSMSQAAETEDSASERSTRLQAKRSSKKKSKSQKIQELAQQVVEAAVGGPEDREDTARRRRSRLATPDNAEELEIDPKEVFMSELTKDIKVGRKSETEKRMQENWVEIKRRRKEEVEKRREAARGKNSSNQEDRNAVEEVAVPRQIIVNGVITVANESREVAFGAGAELAARENADVAIEDDRIYKYVNQGTLGKSTGRGRRSQWDENTTNLFYKGLRMFGTDFSMISNLFPESIDRPTVKKKYQVELLADPQRVEACVAAKETVSIEEYAEMTNMEFEDPDKLMKELEEEERRLREEDEKRKADQGYVVNTDTADVPLPSTERDEGDEVGEDDERGELDVAGHEGEATPALFERVQAPSSTRSERVNALAEKVVQAAVAPKKRQQRRTRESTGAGRAGRGGKKGKRAMEGVEERIGPLDEVEP